MLLPGGWALRHLYDWFGLNVALFHLINGAHAPWWDRCMVTVSWLGSSWCFPLYLAMLLLLAYVAPSSVPRRNVLVFAVGFALTWAAVAVLKPLFGLPRPVLALGPNAVVLVGSPALHASFPSGHAAFVTLLAASCSVRVVRPFKWGLWLFAGAVFVSRISVGAHFPADVVGGAIVGLGGASLAGLLVRAVSARR
ncbi:MAG: phosphatase PAP2 family protein [Candidatus Binatia bacterium]